MGRRAFTLVELLVIVAVIGIMTTAAVLSVTSGQRAMRVKGATRDVFAAIRQARSTALVTQQPAIITYSNDTVDGEPMAKIEITSAKLFDSGVDRSQVQTLTGAPLNLGSNRESQRASSGKESSAKGQESGKENEEGRTVEEILFAPISADVVRGMRLKVLTGDELPANAGVAEERAKPKISVFSNVDYLLGRFKDAKAEAAKQDSEKSAADGGAEKDKGSQPADAEAESEGPVSIVWETNGRVEPHQVWIYPDGARPEDGLSIRIDRFGGAKVVSGDGREE